MKRNIYLSIIFILIMILLRIGIGYVIYKTSDNSNNNVVDKNNNNEILVSRESIKELSKNNKYIDSKFEDKINYLVSYGENIQINNQDVFLLLDNGKVYLYSNSYREYDHDNDEWLEKSGIEYKSLISNIDENVVMIKETVSGNCDAGDLEYGILTDKGNLYVIKVLDNIVNSEDILTLLSQNKDINLSFKKLTEGNLKVMAFTTYFYDDRYNTCTQHGSPLFVNDNTLRDYETFEIAKPIIYFTEVYDDGGFVVYDNYTISIDNNSLIKDKDNNNFIIKAYYEDDNLNKKLLLDKNNYLYFQEENSSVKLYKDSKVVNIAKEIVSYGETSNTWDDINEFIITFDNNETLEIKVVYDEYKIFE